MIPWQHLASAPVPGTGQEIRLYRRGDEFSLRTCGAELMNSRVHGSEEALAALACGGFASAPSPRVLVGGLGMGYTLAAALRRLGAAAQVVVAEVVPAVVAWNRGPWPPWRATPWRTRGWRSGKATWRNS
jgi:spermidine synthase